MVEIFKLKDLNFFILYYIKYKKRFFDRLCDIKLFSSIQWYIKLEVFLCVIRELFLGGLGGVIYICLKVKQDFY